MSRLLTSEMVGKATSSRRRATVSASWVVKGASVLDCDENPARVRAAPSGVKALSPAQEKPRDALRKCLSVAKVTQPSGQTAPAGPQGLQKPHRAIRSRGNRWQFGRHAAILWPHMGKARKNKRQPKRQEWW